MFHEALDNRLDVDEEGDRTPHVETWIAEGEEAPVRNLESRGTFKSLTLTLTTVPRHLAFFQGVLPYYSRAWKTNGVLLLV